MVVLFVKTIQSHIKHTTTLALLQKTREISASVGLMLYQRRRGVPTINQHWINLSRLLGSIMHGGLKLAACVTNTLIETH